MALDLIQLRLTWSYCEHFYGGTGPRPMAFYGPVTCKNYDYPWGTWNLIVMNLFEGPKFVSIWRTWNLIWNLSIGGDGILAHFFFWYGSTPLGGTEPLPMIFSFDMDLVHWGDGTLAHDSFLSYMTSTIICLCTVLNTCQGCRIIMCNTG